MTGRMVHLGPLYSAMVPLPGVQAGTPITPQRESNAFMPVGGIPNTSVAPNAARSWQITFSPWSSPETAAVLRAMAAGVIKNARLWTPEAAVMNLLPQVAVDVDHPESMLIPSGSSAVVDFVGGFTGAIPSAFRLDGDVLIPIPLAERAFTISAWVHLAASGDQVLRVIANGSTVATITAPSTISVPTLIKASFTVPLPISYLTISPGVTETARWCAPRLVAASSSDGKYSVGHGVPVVRVADPQAVMQNTAADVRADYSVTLTEEAE